MRKWIFVLVVVCMGHKYPEIFVTQQSTSGFGIFLLGSINIKIFITLV